jgi:hypothetical protein
LKGVNSTSKKIYQNLVLNAIVLTFFDVERGQHNMSWLSGCAGEKTVARKAAASNHLFNATLLTSFDVKG